MTCAIVRALASERKSLRPRHGAVGHRISCPLTIPVTNTATLRRPRHAAEILFHAAAADFFWIGAPSPPTFYRLAAKGSPTKWYFCRIFLLLILIAIFSQNRMMSWPGDAHKNKLAQAVNACQSYFGYAAATSAPSERIFSTARLAVNAKRSSLAPSAVDKVVFVHEKSHLVNERTDWKSPSRCYGLVSAYLGSSYLISWTINIT